MFNFLALLVISEFLVAYITIVASDWPRTFFTPKVFLFSIELTKRSSQQKTVAEEATES